MVDLLAMITIASICIFRGVPTCYSYEIPSALKQAVVIGHTVLLPFGKSTVSGLVLSIEIVNSAPESMTLKPIVSISEMDPVIPADLCHLIDWFYHFYRCTPFKAFQSIIGKRKQRNPLPLENTTITPSPHRLNTDQQQAFDTITQSKGFSQHLIHGITGSGKTEIYMRLAEHCLSNNTRIIICCPEISLTPQFRTQFTERFHDHVVVIHSGLTPKQRDERWHTVLSGNASIVIGPRSVIFSPLPTIGMIIIDEEHDQSYKQDTHPRYYTHHVAEERCRYQQCPLVLGSATPSISTFLHTQKNCRVEPKTASYTYLAHRATGSTLPSIDIINMQDESVSKNSLSTPLLTAIQSHLDQQGKVLLLLNRRGYAPYISCQSCNTIHSCPHCELSYTYHSNKTFRCHRCDITLPVSHTCKKCNKPHLAFGGQAIQKIETELQQHFRNKSIIRLDKDTAKTAKQLESLLNTFKASGDILLGTQLIAKGHHIEDITLVGILGIDTQLNIPDFTAAERSFQLVMQVAGRAGRGSKKGHVIIQTVQPHHYALQCAKTHDYDAFIEQEAVFRSELNYPPFTELTYIIFSCPIQSVLTNYTNTIKKLLKTQTFPSHVHVIGPQPAPIEKVRTHFRYSLLIKHFNTDNTAIREFISSFPPAPKIMRVIADFNPQQLL